MADSTFRERFLESDDRFQAAMLAAIKAHQEGVAIFLQTHQHLQESIDELKGLIMEQGVQLTAQGAQIRELRSRLG
jgi:hypothetical protein